jgi:hypothetical protein
MTEGMLRVLTLEQAVRSAEQEPLIEPALVPGGRTTVDVLNAEQQRRLRSAVWRRRSTCHIGSNFGCSRWRARPADNVRR